MVHDKHIVVIGGGTGSFTLLSVLRTEFSQITALVNMADNGGSTGVLRDELGVLPPGDVRQCLIALSNAPDALRQLFSYRFPTGSSLEGHSFGNLFLSAVEMQTSNFNESIRLASEVLNIRGAVIPVTLTNCHLMLEKQGGLIKGETAIGVAGFTDIGRPELYLAPEAPINPKAVIAIASADMIVIAPGNLYRSLAPALLVRGMDTALQKTRATVVYVCNLVNKHNETDNFAVHDYVDELQRFIGTGVVDTVVYNNDIPDRNTLTKYALDGEFPVGIDRAKLKAAQYKAVGTSLLARGEVIRDPNDTRIERSLIRHDAVAVTNALKGLF